MNLLSNMVSASKKFISSVISSISNESTSDTITKKPSLNITLYNQVRRSGYKIDETTFAECDFHYKTYYILGTLGKGAFGTVSLAYNSVEERWVALKTVQKSRLAAKNLTKLVIREINILSVVSHPNICKLYRAFETADAFVLEMEYIHGPTLSKHIRVNGGLCEEESKAIFAQIVDCVNYLHTHKIVHRDLKPANMIMDENGKVTIIDFGFAITYEYDSQYKTFCGTREYQSPEILSREPYFGPEVDVWSLGIVLFYMTHGRKPFTSSDRRLANKKTIMGEFDINSDISIELKDLLLRMICRSPRERAKTIEITTHPWLHPHVSAKYQIQPIKNIDENIILCLENFGFAKYYISERLDDKESSVPAIYQLFAVRDESIRYNLGRITKFADFISDMSTIKDAKRTSNKEEETRSEEKIEIKIKKQDANMLKGRVYHDELVLYLRLARYMIQNHHRFMIKDDHIQVLVSRNVNALFRIFIKKVNAQKCKIKFQLVCGSELVFRNIIDDIFNSHFITN